MIDQEPAKTAPHKDEKVLSPKQEKVRQQKLEAKRSGNWRWWPSKRRQNEWD